MNNTLYIVRGLPGSGKSTFAKKLLEKGMADTHYEADMFFYQNGSYNFDPSKLAAAHGWCKARVLADLKAGKNVVVSNTFTRFNEMDPYIQYCKDNGISFKVIRITTQFQNIHNVPANSLERMKARFQNYPGEILIR